jgi:hypothetical protein
MLSDKKFTGQRLARTGFYYRGAYEVGMYPVLIMAGITEEFPCVSPDERDVLLAQQEGTVISSLEEVLTVLALVE